MMALSVAPIGISYFLSHTSIADITGVSIFIQEITTTELGQGSIQTLQNT